MDGLTTQERLVDISRRTGLSESVIRTVLNAERDSIVDSLLKGEKATLIGRCTLRPEVRLKIDPTKNPPQFKYVKINASVAPSLQGVVERYANQKTYTNAESEEELPEGIMVRQIASLI